MSSNNNDDEMIFLVMLCIRWVSPEILFDLQSDAQVQIIQRQNCLYFTGHHLLIMGTSNCARETLKL